MPVADPPEGAPRELPADGEDGELSCLFVKLFTLPPTFSAWADGEAIATPIAKSAAAVRATELTAKAYLTVPLYADAVEVAAGASSRYDVHVDSGGLRALVSAPLRG